MARPTSDRKRTEMPNFRMSKGESALLQMKASIEGISMSELVRRAVEAYRPIPKPETCIECGKTMVLSEYEKEIAIELDGEERTVVISGVPAMKCDCGEMIYDLDVACNIEELVDRLVNDALRYNKDIPHRISVEELFGEDYLGAK